VQSRSQAPDVLEVTGRAVATRWEWAWEFADDPPVAASGVGPMREVWTRWDWHWEFAEER